MIQMALPHIKLACLLVLQNGLSMTIIPHTVLWKEFEPGEGLRQLLQSGSRLAQGLVLPLGTPGGAPLGSLPTLGDIDRFSGDLVTSEFEDVDAVVPGSAVIPDRVLRHPEVSLASYPSDLELYGGRVALPPGKEVRFPFKPLLGLRELQHRVVMVYLVRNLIVRAFVFPVAP